MAALVGLFGAFWFIVFGLLMAAIGILWPVAMFSVMRSARSIQRQLERLNGNVESGRMVLRFTSDPATQEDAAREHRAGAGAGPLKL
jgi:hypothetical protein